MTPTPIFTKKWSLNSEQREKIRKSKLGKSPSLETRQKISTTLKGKHFRSSSQFPRGFTPWSKGKKLKPLSEEHRKKIGNSLRGKTLSYSMKGDKNPFYGKKHTKEWIENYKIKRKNWSTPKKDTKPERVLQTALLFENIRFEKHKPIMGQPDIFIEPNICVFVDGDYWHSLEKVKQRDVLVTEFLEKDGYIVLRFWENEILTKIEPILLSIKAVKGG